MNFLGGRRKIILLGAVGEKKKRLEGGDKFRLLQGLGETGPVCSEGSDSGSV